MSTTNRAKTDLIVIHCAATKPNQDIGRKEIDVWHRQRGFLEIGYNFVIRRDGTVEKGREEQQIGAHAEGHNNRSIGICLVGGTDANDIKKAENNFTDPQWTALEELLRRLVSAYPDVLLKNTLPAQWRFPRGILGHRDLPGVKKACPSFDVKEWLASLTTPIQ